jgi:hypothetical protein
MKEVEITATTGTKKDGDIKEIKGVCKQYDSLDEAEIELGTDTAGQSKALILLNRAVKTEALNQLRAGSAGPSLNTQLSKLKKENPAKFDEAMAVLKSAGLVA